MEAIAVPNIRPPSSPRKKNKRVRIDVTIMIDSRFASDFAAIMGEEGKERKSRVGCISETWFCRDLQAMNASLLFSTVPNFEKVTKSLKQYLPRWVGSKDEDC